MKKILKKICSVLLLVALVCQVIPPIAVISAETAEPVDISGYSGLVISRVFGTGGKSDAVSEYSFIELYNASDSDLCLTGLALYYMTKGDLAYQSFEFSDNITISGGEYYLIRCKAAKKYDKSKEIICLTDYDAEWKIDLNNKDISLVLAATGRTLDVSIEPAEMPEVISYFCAREKADYYFDTGYIIKDFSKNTFAVRTALKEDSGWYAVDLRDQNASKLRQILPMYSGGVAGEITGSGLTGGEVFFSRDAGIYENGFQLTLSASDGYQTIYYTLDGSDPCTSSTRLLYSAPLSLSDTSSKGPGATTTLVAQLLGSDYIPLSADYPGGYVVKAVATDGESFSDVYTNTYFISSLFADYGVTVMSVSMDKMDFGGSENGFYNPNNYYTNTNQSNESSVGLLEVFDKDGIRRGYSNVELSINGHASADYAMKSMKIKFKKDFNQVVIPGTTTKRQAGGLENKLNYDLFDGYAKNEKGQAITSFSRLVLRDGGNDLYNALMRDAFQQRASSSLDVDTTAATPVLVFINGEFWGWYNVRERYTQQYVEDHYGVDKDNVVTLENDYTLVRTNTNAPLVVNDGKPGDEVPFNDLVEFIKTHNLSIEENYQYVVSQLDTDSFMDMYIAHLFFNAVDWPENNIKIWRNIAAEENDPSGKWHFTLHDTDFGVGFCDYSDYGYSIGVLPTVASVDIFDRIDSTASVIGNVMHALIQNTEFKEAFIARCYRVFRELYTPQNLSSLLDEMTAVRAPLMELQVKRWGRDYDPTLKRNISINAYNQSITRMYSFVNSRQVVAVKQLCNYFGYTEDQIKALCGYDASDPSIIPPVAFIGASFDNIYVNNKQRNSGGNANNWVESNISNRTLSRTQFGVISSIGMSGWIGFDSPIEAFGYSINGTVTLSNNFFGYSEEAAVLLDINGGQYARRFNITIPITDQAGQTQVVAVVKAGGKVIPIDSTLVNVNPLLVNPDTTFIVDNTVETPPVTPDPGEPEDPPSGEPVFVGASFDTIYRNGSPLNTGANIGNANNWITANLPARTLERSVFGQTTTVGFSGWIGFDRDITALGYVINGGQPVWGNYIIQQYDPAVQLPQNGGSHAVRFNVANIPVDPTGLTTVVAVANVGGMVVPIDSHLVNTNTALVSPDTTLKIDNTVMPKTSYDQLKIDGIDVGSFGNNPNPSILDLTGYAGKQLEIWGWHANATGISRFGYRVDGGTEFWSDSFKLTNETTQDVINAGISAVGPEAHTSRFKIFVPIAAGSHTVEALCDTGNGILSIWTVEYQSGELPSEPEPEPETEPKLEIAAYNLSFLDSVYIKYAVDTDLDSEISMLIWLEPQENYTVGSQYAVLSSTDTETVFGKDMMIFKFSGLAAKQMADDVYARAYTVKDGQTYYSDVKKYSILQYVYNMTGKTGTASDNPNLIALLNAMLDYGAAAQTCFGYRTNRLVNADIWYQITVTGGTISDGSVKGLYVTGDSVTLTAPSVDADGYPFSHWETAGGVNAGTTRSITVTVGTANVAYTAVYSR